MFYIEKTSVLGQSDIKKLLKENYRLRTENWTLRDEYDRLDKLVKTKNQPNGQSARVSCDSREYYGDYCKSGYDFDDSYRCYNCLVDDVSLADFQLNLLIYLFMDVFAQPRKKKFHHCRISLVFFFFFGKKVKSSN